MNMKKIVYLIILIITSCSSSNKRTTELVLKNEQNEKAFELTPLEGGFLTPDTDIPLGNIVDLIGDHIIISSHRTPNAFKVFQIKGDSLITTGEFLKRGEGPFEMIQPFAFYNRPEKRLYIYDHAGQIRSIYSIELQNIHNLYETSNWKEIQVPVIEDYFLGSWMRKVGDNSFLILGSKVRSREMLSKIDLTRNSISELNCPYPEQDGTFNMSPIVKQTVYLTGVIERHPKSDKIVYACESGKYAEIIDLTNPEINRTLMLATYPKYITDDGLNKTFLEDCLRGIQVRVTEKYIYLLPYPLTKGEVRRDMSYKGYPNYCSDELLVFNWEGKFAKKYIFDTPIYSFVVDESDCSLYAATVDLKEDNEIMKKYILDNSDV